MIYNITLFSCIIGIKAKFYLKFKEYQVKLAHHPCSPISGTKATPPKLLDLN